MDQPNPLPPVALPLLPLRDIVVFPNMVVPLFVGREKSILALEQAMAGDKQLVLAAQKRAKSNDPAIEDIFETGVLGHIVQILRLGDGTVKVLVEGRARVRISVFTHSEPYFACEASVLVDTPAVPVDRSEPAWRDVVRPLMDSVLGLFEAYVKLTRRIQAEMLTSLHTVDDPGRLADTVVAHVALKLKDKQDLLELIDPVARLARLQAMLQSETEQLTTERRLKAKSKKAERVRDVLANEAPGAVGREARDGGERDEFKQELIELEGKIRGKGLPEAAADRALKEFKKLRQMTPMSAEATVIRNYIDWILALPWQHKDEERSDIAAAEAILEAEHYGMGKVKERILEYLAVKSLVGGLRGPILCLVGPPGVGKTSLARSIAHATGRKFGRVSLGGVRDEAEIRGHRRTYIGAMPGKLLQTLRKVGAGNAVILLDEIDKLAMDFRGDPAAALLEVLDPEQNHAFGDHYLDLDYDLSDVLFVATANVQSQIPIALQDRLEILEVPGYTEWEKLAIARQYLLPKQRTANGIDGLDLELGDDALRFLLHRYTKEAGVRNLERELATLCRKLAKSWLAGGKQPEASFRLDEAGVEKLLGVTKYRERVAEAQDEVGVCNGLAVTMVGGDLLPAEVMVVPGKGQLTLTGKLGEVMRESAQAAMSYIRSRADSFGLARDFHQKVDVHVHCPEGAIPKDGPSAGITMATAMVSAFLRVPVKASVAMTGEITLRGRVLPIGGLKEKVLAAHRAGITTVIIPDENRKDLAEVPPSVLEQLTIVPVSHVDEVLAVALALSDAEGLFASPSNLIDWRIDH